jgi:vacuolar-type H+-ATPase subunit H
MGDELVTQRELAVLREHFRELRDADQRALSIKEAADSAALDLAREHQVYRDEQANRLREQITEERGNYVTRADLAGAVAKIEAELKPVLTYMVSQQGRSAGISAFQVTLIALATLAVGILGVALAMGR